MEAEPPDMRYQAQPGNEYNHLGLLYQVRHSLKAVNFTDRAASPVETLSGGMQRRLNIAVALVHQPKLVILDEPTTGLNIEARYEIWDLIQRLQSQGITVLLTTHLLDEAERLCQKIGI
jgi:ABC-2 type transport system ATP-binding protein